MIKQVFGLNIYRQSRKHLQYMNVLFESLVNYFILKMMLVKLESVVLAQKPLSAFVDLNEDRATNETCENAQYPDDL